MKKEVVEMAVSVFKIEYVIPSKDNESNWTAFVGAFTHEEAIKHVQEKVKKPIKVTASGLYCRLDDISSSVRKAVIEPALASMTKIPNVGVKSDESNLEEVAIKDGKKR